MNKISYSEGSLILVPLRKGGFARGVIARTSPKGKGLFGYFFGPRLDSSDTVILDGLNADKAILRVRFGDLGLINGEWLVYGRVPNWNRSEWPMPDFVRKDPLGRMKSMLVRYSDIDPMRVEAEYPIDDDEGLSTDSAYGYGAVEIELTKLLS